MCWSESVVWGAFSTAVPTACQLPHTHMKVECLSVPLNICKIYTREILHSTHPPRVTRERAGHTPTRDTRLAAPPGSVLLARAHTPS